MGAKSYFRLNSMWRKGATLAALISLLGSALTFLETPPPAAAALVSNNLVLNLDGNSTSSLAATSPTTWNSISPATTTPSGTINGPTRYTETNRNGLTFTSSNGVYFPAGTARTAGDMSFDAWVRPGNLNAEWNLIASRWFTSPADGVGGAQDWHFGIRSGKLHLATASTGSAGFYGNTVFPQTSANKWYHVGFTINAATGKAQLFVNGQADSLENNATRTDNATAQLWLGENRTSGGIYGAPMVLSKVRIYNAALTAGQQAQNYLTDSANYGYAPANTVAPSISGTARVGTALTTPGGTWGVGDADGTTTAYQWQTSTDSTTWTNISGATSASYTPVAGDATNFLRVNVTKTNTAASATATSASTLRVQTSSGISILSGSKLTGFTSTVPNDGTTYNVTLATNNLAATMRLGTTTGLTLINGYASTASFMASTIGASAPIISFRGTGTAINTALANVTYTSATQQTDVVKLYYATAGTTTTDTKDYIPIYDNNQLKFHYYAYKVHAAGKNRAGMDASVAPLGPTDGVEAPGPWYLTTPRYQVEWDRIKLIVGQNQSFMGARADSGSTNWYWPANTDGYTSATIFGTQSGSTVTATSNIFNQTNTTLPYHTGEPNGGTSVGRSGFFYINNNQLGWDDVFLDNSAVPSFTMETYGTAPFNTGSTGVLTQTVNVAASNADAPTGFTAAAAGTGSIAMGWNLTSANTTGVTITGYRMEASTTSNFTSIVASSTPSTFKAGRISGLAANTLYYVRVLAMTSAGNGPSTSPIAVTTTATATTITVVSSGGGIQGTDYSLIDGFFVPKSGLSVSINASAIQTVLGSTAVTLAADNVVVNAPIVWNLFTHLTLGISSTSNVSVNQSITANSANAWIHIPPSTYSLDVKSGARINFPAAGTSNRLYVGGTMHTVLKSEADLATVVAGGSYALGNSITLATSYTTSPISQIFSGTFDGLGNRISALKLATGVAGNYGLFNSITAGGVIRNLGVTNADITLGGNDYRAGVIAGVSTGGTIDQVWSTGFIRTTTTNNSLALGGLVGNAPSGTTNISRSWSSVNIDSSTSGSGTSLEQGGLIGGDELTVPQAHTLSGGSVNLSQVYATGTLKWASNSHRGIGGLMGLKYSTGTTTMTDAFSWVTFSAGVPLYNQGGIVGVAAGGTTTLTRTYQTTSSLCVAGVEPGFSAIPECNTQRTPGATVSGISGSNWAASGATVLTNLAAPTRPLYVQVVAPTDGSYATVSYRIVDGSGALQNTAALSALNLSVSGTPVYRAAGVVLNASSAKATYSTYYDTGLTLGGSSAGSYSLSPWRENTSVTISKLAQTVTWAPTTSVSFGSGTFTPSPAPVASGGTTISYSVSSAGTTGCTVNSSTGAITYTRGGSCAITATAASAGDWLIASDTETFVIAEPATAPTGLASTTAGSGMLNIGWAAPTVSSSAAITGYTLTYSTNAGMSSPTTVNVGNTRGYLLTGLTSGTVYYYQVRAVSGSTWTGPLSTIASATPNSTATTINVVASGGGTAGTDFTINGGVISTTGTASINASAIAAVLATEGTVQLAATNVNVNAAISWSANSVLVLGNTSAATVNVNSTIAGSGNTAGVNILPSTYGLLVKSGAHIRLTGTTPSFNLGGTSYTVVNTVAGLSNVAAGTTWALTAPIILTAAYTTAVRDVTFTGIMDGLGNTISNMDITATVTRNAGFYAALGGATVRNVGFTNVNIKSPTGGIDTRLGSVAGNGSTAGTNTVTQVWATGFINQTSSADNTRTEAGGLFGGATAGTLNISRSWSSVSISTNSPGVGSGGIIGTNVSTFAGGAGVGNTLTISESYSTGNILRTLPPTTAWYGNGGIIGVAYGLSTTLNNVFSWGNVNSSGTNAGTSVGGIVGPTTNATVANSYTTSATIGVASPTNSVVNVTAGTAPATGTGFGTGLWSTVNGASLVNLAPPTKLLYVRVKAPTDGSFGTVGTEIVDSTGTVQTLSSLNLSVSGTPVFDTISSSTAKGTYSANYASGLTLGGSSAGVYSLGAWITSTSVTISKFSQTVTWAPTTSVNFGNGTLTPSASATSSGGTTISYAVSTAGTTGCTVNSSTGVITYTSAGTCTVTATAANAGDYLAASTSVAFVIGAAPTLTVVATGGGTAGTDFVLSGGVLSASANASINASYLTTQLASGNVTLAGNVVVNTPITWSGNFVLTLGGTSTNSVAVNSSITGSGNTAGLVIKPSTYSLSTKDGAAISLSGTNPTLSIGGNSYTLIKSIAELSNVTATAGTFWALAKPLSFSTTIDRPAINVAFAGTLDGLGNTVDNMRLTSTANLGAAFIKNLNNGTVRNLGVTNSVISLEPTVNTNNLNAGGLVGDSAGGTIDQVWTTGFMRVKEGSTYSGLTMGGLVGDVYSGTLNITKSWSALNLNGWGSTYTNLATGGVLGGTFGTWSATGTTAGGSVNMSQVYSLGDIANPNTTGSLSGLGGILGVHTGTGTVSIIDSFSWSQARFFTGSVYGGIVGIGNGGTMTLTNYRTILAQDFTSTGTSSRTITNGFINAAFGGSNATLEALPNWYSSAQGVALRNLPVPYKNFYVRVIAPTDGSYNTLSYRMTNGVGVNLTPSNYSLSISGTPTYSEDSDVEISETPYDVDYVSGLTFTYNGALSNVYQFAAYPYPTSVTISKYSQSITLTSSVPTDAKVSNTYTLVGSASSDLAITYTIAGSSSSVCSISGNVVTFNAVGDCVVNANQAGNTSYLSAAQVQQTISVAKGDQSVSITSTAPTGGAAKVGRTYSLSGSADSGLAISYSIDAESEDVCNLSGTTVSLVAIGTCTVLANQAGDDNWNEASESSQTFAVTAGSAVITISSTDETPKVSGTYTPTATSTSPGEITFSISEASSEVCSIASGVVTYLSVGSCVINADQVQVTNWLAAAQVQQTIEVAKGDQTLEFTSDASAPKVGTSYTVAGTSTAGLSVTFSIAGSSAAICEIDGSTISFLAVGDCVVNANQSGDENWNSAGQIQETIEVVKGDPTLEFTSEASAPKVGTSYSPEATVTGGGTVTFSIADESAEICTEAGGVVSFLAVGDCVIEANSGTTTNWNAAPQITQTVTVAKGTPSISFTSTIPPSAVVGGDTYEVVASKTQGTVNSVVFTVDSTTSTICSINGDSVSFLAVGTCKVNANLDGDEQYEAATEIQQEIEVGQGSQIVTITSIAPVAAVVDGDTYTVTTTGGASGNPVYLSVTESSAEVCELSGSEVSFIGAGNCEIKANQNGSTNYLAASEAIQSFTVGKGAQVITFTSTAPTNAVVDGTTYTITATGGATDLAVTFTVDDESQTVCEISNGVVSFLTVGVCQVNANQAGNDNYLDAEQVFQTITVDKGFQTIDFTSLIPQNARVSGSAYTLSATGGASGSAVEFSIDLASLEICSISGDVVSFTGAGDCVVLADQPGNENYLAADQVSQTISVAKGVQSVAFTSTAPSDAVVDGQVYQLAGSGGDSGEAIFFSIHADSAEICELTGTEVSFVGAGDCIILLDQAGNDNWLAAPTEQQAFVVGQGSQTVEFTTEAPSGSVVGGSTYTPVAAGGASGNDVAISIDEASVGVCAITAGVVRNIGVGDCIVIASQSGNVNYLAGSATQTYTVGKGTQNIEFTSIAPETAVVRGATYTPTATGGASLNSVTFTIAEGSSAVCKLTAGVVSFQTPGDCEVLANQLGNTNYNAAPLASQSFTVGKGSQVVSFTSTAPTSAKVGGATYTPVASKGPGVEPVVFSETDGSETVCVVTNGVVSFVGAGTCVIEANQAGDTNYNAATTQTQSFTVAKGIQVLSFTSNPPSLRPVQGTFYTPTAAGGASGEEIVFTIATEAASKCSIDNAGVISFLAVGDCIVYANQAGNGDYLAATQVSQVFDITKGEQVVTFTSTAPSDAVVGGTVYTPTATGGAGTMPVTYRLSELSAEICSVTDGEVSFLASGECIVFAEQAADVNFNAATPVSQTFTVGKGNQTLTFSSIFIGARVGGATYTPTANAGPSESAVIFTIASESTPVCSITNGVVSFQSVGDCMIEANQGGDGNYLPAPQVTQTINVSKGVQALFEAASSLDNLRLGTTPPTAVVSFSGGSGTGEVTWSVDVSSVAVCSIDGDVVTGLAVGWCELTASKASDENYELAEDTLLISVTAGGQAPLRTSVNNDAPTYAPNLALVLSISGGDGTGDTWFESLTPSVCEVSGANGLDVLTAGTCIVVGHKDGDGNFQAAQNSLTFTIAKATQPDVAIEIAEDLTYSPAGAVTSQLSLTGVLSNGIQEYSVIEGSCQLVSDALSASQAGDCVVEASVEGDSRYLPTTVQRTFTIAKAVQENLVAAVADGSEETIAWAGTNTTDFEISGGSGTSSLSAVTSTPSICSVETSGATVTVTGLAQGTCEVTATKPSDSNFLEKSVDFEVTVLDLPNAPQSFEIATAGAGSDNDLSVDVSWEAPELSEARAVITGYEVQTRTADTDWATVENGVLAADATSITLTAPAWSQLFIRVAAISELDATDDTTRNWVTLTEEGTDVELPFDVAGSLTAISTLIASVTSGEVVTLTGAGFATGVTTTVQIATTKPVFGTKVGKTTTYSTVRDIPVTVVSPTKISFVLPKITMPKGFTRLPATVKVLTAENVSTNAMAFDYISKKLSQTVTVTGLPSTKLPLVIANGALVASVTSTGVAPVVSATPTTVCSAAIVDGQVTVTPIGRGTCKLSITAPTTPGYSVSSAKTYAYTIKGAAQSLTFTNPGPKTWSTDVVSLVGTATLNPVFTSKTPTVCTTSGSSLTMVKAGLCTVVATQPGDALNEPATVGATKLTSITQSFTIAKKTRTTGLNATLTDVLADGTKPERTLTYLDSSIVTAPNISVVVGENPLELPVRLNRVEGTVLFSVASADASRCLAEPGSDDPTLALITVSDLGSCKVTITLPADDRWNAHADKIVIWINAIALPPGGIDPTPTGTGDGVLADQELYFDSNPLDKDSDPAVLLAQTGESVTAALGGDLGMAYDAVTGKYQFRSKTLLVGKYTAKMTGPAGTAWFAKASTITQCTKYSKGKCIKSIKVPVTLAVNECVATLTVKKNPKLKKRVLRIIGSGCQLNDAGKAAFNQEGVQNIIFKYQWIRQYPSTGLTYVKKGSKKVRYLKKVKRTIVLSVGRPAN